MRNLIFDVDGTLIDSEKMYLLPLQRVLRANGYLFQYDELKRVFGITALDALKILKVTDAPKILRAWFAEIQNHKQYASVFPGIKPVLAILHRDPAIRMAIATSKVEAEFHRDITRFGLDDYFDAFVFSNEIKAGKPAPDLVLKGMEKLAANPEETIYIGDTVYDLQAAHAAHVAFGLAGWQTKKTAEFATSEVNFKTPNDILTAKDLEIINRNR